MVEHAETHQSICCKQCHQVWDSNNKFQKIIFLQTKLAAAHKIGVREFAPTSCAAIQKVKFYLDI